MLGKKVLRLRLTWQIEFFSKDSFQYFFPATYFQTSLIMYFFQFSDHKQKKNHLIAEKFWQPFNVKQFEVN